MNVLMHNIQNKNMFDSKTIYIQRISVTTTLTNKKKLPSLSKFRSQHNHGFLENKTSKMRPIFYDAH